MEEFATRFADLLENSALKVRSMTVDRFDRGIKITALGVVAATLGIIAVIFLIRAIFNAVAVPLGVVGAYAAFGGLFVFAGAFLWAIRKRQPKEDDV
jgi:drug/metabolite transporter superfamily protein YnfA